MIPFVMRVDFWDAAAILPVRRGLFLGRRRRAIPLHRASQAFLEVDQRLVLQLLLGARDVGERMPHIASPLRRVGDVARVSGQRLQQLERFVQGEAISGGDVERLAGYVLLWSGGSQQVCRHSVVNEVEVARLLTVAIDRRLFAAQHLRDELCQHRRIL